MDQLIRRLEQKIAYLIKELDTAKKEVVTLRHQLSIVINSEHHTLTDNSKDYPSTDQLQMYIDDSLDLAISSKKIHSSITKDKKNDQLTFDLPFNSNKIEP